MSSLYDKLYDAPDNYTRQQLLNIVRKHFEYNDELLNEFFINIKTMYERLFKKDYNINKEIDDVNLKDVIDNMVTFETGIFNKKDVNVLQKIIGLNSKEDIIDWFTDNKIFEKKVKYLLPFLEREEGNKNTYLLACYFFNKNDINFMVNAAPLLLLTFPNLNYYLKEHNYTIKRSENKRKIKDGIDTFRHYVYTIYHMTNKTTLKRNQPKKIIYDYAYTEMYDTKEEQSYYVR